MSRHHTRPEIDLDALEAEHPIAQLADQLPVMWARGWHPLDIARIFSPSSELELAVLGDCLALDRRRWHRRAGVLWTEQADQLGDAEPWWQFDRPYWAQFVRRHGASVSRAWRAASFFALTVKGAPDLPLLEAPPDRPGWTNGDPTADDGVLARVRALLAKAESTEFEHEAEALSAKAQELITRHAIDVALLAGEVDVPGGHRIYVDPPYAKAKFLLLAQIAAANGCRCAWHDPRKTATLIGHRSDIWSVELLFTSLLLQGTTAVVAAGPQHDGFGGSTTRSWRNAFWHGYAGRIGQRLRVATEATRAQQARHLGTDLLPVLARRDEAVDRAFADAFPRLGSLRTSMSNLDGMLAGHRTADRADLDTDRRVDAPPPRTLPR